MKTKTRPMKACIKNLFLPSALIAGLNFLPATWVTAQTFTILHRSNGSEGFVPQANLILSGDTLYGTEESGGSSSFGVVFAVNTGGMGFTNLYSFTAGRTNSSGTNTNYDGTAPVDGLILSGNTLFGTTSEGGSWGNGTVFAVGTDGNGFKTLHTFAGYPSEGASSRAGLILVGNMLYGTTIEGGSSGNGTVFAINTNGTGFTNLHSFSAGSNIDNGYYTNSDGANPWAGLVVSGNTLYGTAVSGGSSGRGTAFALNTDGTGFATLHNFSDPSTNSSGVYTNSDGAFPWAGLTVSGGTLFGTAADGGSSGFGTVFAVNTNGTGFTTLHSFTTTSDPSAPFGTNSDGAYPCVGLVLAGDILYGRTALGGSSGRGTIFAVKTNGTGFANVHSFAYSNDLFPFAGLTLAGNTLYGTTIDYFADGYYGTLFSLSFRPQLTITRSGESIILSWPTTVAGFDYTGYTLQASSSLIPPVGWLDSLTPPSPIGSQFTVTNIASSNDVFFRLIKRLR